MGKQRIVRQAWSDIDDVTYTQERFGVSKRSKYGGLIEQALRAIAEDPSRGRPWTGRCPAAQR